MLGNVAEWTHGFLGSPPRDPTDPWDDAGGAVHATRGGSADMAPALLRHAARKTAPADFGDACIGLRLARTMP
jgi:formylglycine-generating enzyme required for sulfatase activity